MHNQRSMRLYDREEHRHLNDSERYRDYEYLAEEFHGPNEHFVVPHLPEAEVAEIRTGESPDEGFTRAVTTERKIPRGNRGFGVFRRISRFARDARSRIRRVVASALLRRAPHG